MMVMVEKVVMLLIAVQVVVEHRVVMFMILFLVDGLSLLEAVEEEVEVPGMLVQMLEEMVEIGNHYLVL